MARNMVLTYLHLLDPGIPIEGSNKTSTKQGKKKHESSIDFFWMWHDVMKNGGHGESQHKGYTLW